MGVRMDQKMPTRKRILRRNGIVAKVPASKKILIQQRPRERERIELWAAENMAMGRWVKYDDWRRTAGGAKD